MIKVIGIDPGLAATGIGIITGTGLTVSAYSYGVIRTGSRMTTPRRLDHIFSRLSSILEQEKPDRMVLEAVFSLDCYPKSGISLGNVTGVILLAAHRAGLMVDEIPVREVKRILTGNGKASKGQLEKAVRARLHLTTPMRPFHCSDAVGLALIGLFRCR